MKTSTKFIIGGALLVGGAWWFLRRRAASAAIAPAAGQAYVQKYMSTVVQGPATNWQTYGLKPPAQPR